MERDSETRLYGSQRKHTWLNFLMILPAIIKRVADFCQILADFDVLRVVPEGGIHDEVKFIALVGSVQELLSLAERLFEQSVNVVHVVRGQGGEERVERCIR